MKGHWYIWVLLTLLIASFIGNAVFLAKLRKKPELITVTTLDSIALKQKEQFIQELQKEIEIYQQQDSLLAVIDLRLQEKIKGNEKELVQNIRRVRQLHADGAAKQLARNLSESLIYRRRYDSELPEVPSGPDQ